MCVRAGVSCVSTRATYRHPERPRRIERTRRRFNLGVSHLVASVLVIEVAFGTDRLEYFAASRRNEHAIASVAIDPQKIGTSARMLWPWGETCIL